MSWIMLLTTWLIIIGIILMINMLLVDKPSCNDMWTESARHRWIIIISIVANVVTIVALVIAIKAISGMATI